MYLDFTYPHFDSRSSQGDTKNLKEDYCVHSSLRLHFEKGAKDSHQNLYLFLASEYLKMLGE